MVKRILLILLALVVGGLAGIKVLQIRKMIAAGKHKTMPPAIVTTAPVRAERWQTRLRAVGSLSAVQGVMVAAELPGKVEEILFSSGTRVEKGDVLVRLDTITEQARLSSAKAAVALARINRDRARALVEKKSMSRSGLDTTEAAYTEAVAARDEIRAIIDKKTIRAPFSGRLGIRRVNLGQIVSTGDPIVQLQSLDPVYVDFSLPQQDLVHLRQGLVVQVTTDVLPGKTIEGKIIALSPGVDPASRSIRVRARVGNKEEQLRPGMFVRVAVVLPEEQDVLLIPATAVLYAPYGNSVFVLDPAEGAPGGNKEKGRPAHVLRKQVVRTGVARGDYVTVVSGLKEGELVVTTGVFKFRNGQPAMVDNTLAPEFKLHPRVENR